jgi:hypothetical protein
LTSWLIYHPRREVNKFDGLTVYYDEPKGNQDPYIWSDRFLHSYCHVTQSRFEEGDTEFWVSGDSCPNVSVLPCDLVFVIKDKIYWSEANNIHPWDPPVDGDHLAYNDHYRWFYEHPLKRRARFTLKADAATSFQPQNALGDLVDVVPILAQCGLELSTLRVGLKAGFAARPMALPDAAGARLNLDLGRAPKRLYGPQLREIRSNHPELASL